MRKGFLKVDITMPEYAHPDFRYGSLGGAIVSVLQNVKAQSCTKVYGFYNHKGEKRNWGEVRTLLSSERVQKKLPYRFRTELTVDGMYFYAIGKRKSDSEIDNEWLRK